MDSQNWIRNEISNQKKILQWNNNFVFVKIVRLSIKFNSLCKKKEVKENKKMEVKEKCLINQVQKTIGFLIVSRVFLSCH